MLWCSSLSESSVINIPLPTAAASAHTQCVPSLQNPHGSGILAMPSENAGATGGLVIYAVVKSVSSSSDGDRLTEGVVRVRFGVLLLGDIGLF